MGNINFYDLFYRNYTNYTDIKRAVKECLYELKTIESNDFNEIKFSDVTYTKFPIFDEANNYSGGNYVPVFLNKMDRFKKFDIDNLPFIDVAKLLGIKVEKSANIDSYGRYMIKENKIILCSDYIPTFIHELVHAIVHITDIKFILFYYDEMYDVYNEFVAEFTAVVLCKIYNININIPYSMYYIKMYLGDFENDIPDDIIKIVECICEYIKECKKVIENDSKVEQREIKK
jgi:hypothetical protein